MFTPLFLSLYTDTGETFARERVALAVVSQRLRSHGKGSQTSTRLLLYACAGRDYRRLQIASAGSSRGSAASICQHTCRRMGRDGGVGECPVAAGGGGMPDSAAMTLTGGRRLGKRKMARTAKTKDGAVCAWVGIGQVSG